MTMVRATLVFGTMALAVVWTVGTGRSQPPKKDPYAEHIASTAPRSPEEEQKLFHLPPGFEIQLVASEPEIKKPINIAFDSRGRIWVTQSIEYPFPATDLGKSRDTLKILDQIGANGRAGKISTFATGLNIPIGVLPDIDANGAIVYSIPNLWHMRDTQKAGQADQREPVFGPYEFRDTHGMTGEFQRGFDGWIYACHGYFNTTTIKAKDGSTVTMSSGNTYRFRPDGSHVEYWTHGQVNPFGLAFDPLGNLFSCDCHTRPVMQLLRHGWYPSFGRPNDGLGFAPEMMTHDHGSTAIAGITYYAATHFPPEYRDNVFIGNVVTNRINRDRLDKHGSTYLAIEMPDFVKCDDPWFRPVDIRLGPDGAMYIADFYTRIIGHYEVPLKHPLRDNQHGRIWRIVYTGKGATALPALTNLDSTSTDDLFAALRDPNLTVRMTATHQLTSREPKETGIKALKVIRETDDSFQKAHSLWVLERLQSLPEGLLANAMTDASPIVRVHALRIAVDRPDLPQSVRASVLAGLKDKDAFVQRTAAEVLGNHPLAENLLPLLEIHHRIPADDTHLLYAVRVALKQIALVNSNWKSEGILAVDLQKLEDRRAIADVLPAVPSANAAVFLANYVRENQEAGPVEANYLHHIGRFGNDALTGQIAGFVESKRGSNLLQQLNLYRSLQKGRQESGRPQGKSLEDLGLFVSGKLLASTKQSEVVAGLEVIGSSRFARYEADAIRLASASTQAEPVRAAALSALAAMDGGKHAPVLAAVLENAKEPPALREKAATALAGINAAPARAALVKAMSDAPARLEMSIAQALAGSKQGAALLLDTIAAGKASPRLLLDVALVNKLRQAQVANLDPRIKSLTRGMPSADANLQQMIAARRNAFGKSPHDIAKGMAVFEKHCAVCHLIANKGAKIGPQLDGIGIRGLDRLLEDVLDPNRNVDQAFRTTTITMKDGKVLSGLFLREEGAILVLADQQGKEVRVPRDNVDQRTVVQLSPMPADFGVQIPEPDFVNLMAYLLDQRAKQK